MQLGMIGLGRMGANMVRRLMPDGHECVVFDGIPPVDELATEGATGATSLADFVQSSRPRASSGSWCPPPSSTTRSLNWPLLAPGDIVIDGGNTYYHDDIAASAADLAGLHYVDVGTSGGVFGLERGFCLMIGGENEVVSHLDGVFAPLAPGVAGGRAHPRPQRATRPRPSTATCTAVRPEPATS